MSGDLGIIDALVLRTRNPKVHGSLKDFTDRDRIAFPRFKV